ncbi:MAG: hypothetical protein ABI411_12560 [Tahibacter sp.]
MKYYTLPCISLLLSMAAGGVPAGIYGPNVPAACLVGVDEYSQPSSPAPSWGAGGQLAALYPYASSGSSVSTQLGERTAGYSVRRIACGNGAAALLFSISDIARYTSPANLIFPGLRAVQDGRTSVLQAKTLVHGDLVPVGEYGTIVAPFFNGFVLTSEDPVFDANRAFQVIVDDPLRARQSATFAVAAYQPTPETYPDAFGPRPVNGRYAGNFFDPAKPGEGIVVEIGDVTGRPGIHFLQFAWHSFDNDGAPFWISGGTSFEGRPRHLHMTSAYRSGGRFGGARAADAQSPWGTVDIEFNDCHTAVIEYAAIDGLPPGIPAGFGRLQWQRLTGISGYECD